METLTDAQIEEVLQRLQEGKGVTEIAHELGLPARLRPLIPDERKGEYDLAVQRATKKRWKVKRKAEEDEAPKRPEPVEENEEPEWPEPVKAGPYPEPEPEPKPKPRPKSKPKPKPESKSKPVSEHEDIIEEVAKRPTPRSEVVKEKPQERKKDASWWEHPIVIAGIVVIGGVALFMLFQALNSSKQRKMKASKRQIRPMDSRETRYKALAEKYKVM